MPIKLSSQGHFKILLKYALLNFRLELIHIPDPDPFLGQTDPQNAQKWDFFTRILRQFDTFLCHFFWVIFDADSGSSWSRCGSGPMETGSNSDPIVFRVHDIQNYLLTTAGRTDEQDWTTDLGNKHFLQL